MRGKQVNLHTNKESFHERLQERGNTVQQLDGGKIDTFSRGNDHEDSAEEARKRKAEAIIAEGDRVPWPVGQRQGGAAEDDQWEV